MPHRLKITPKRRGGPRVAQLPQARIARRMASSELSGRAAKLGPYGPVIAHDEDGHRITDTCAARLAPSAMPVRHAHDHIGVDTRQRRRAAARVEDRAGTLRKKGRRRTGNGTTRSSEASR